MHFDILAQESTAITTAVVTTVPVSDVAPGCADGDPYAWTVPLAFLLLMMFLSAAANTQRGPV